MYCTDCYVNLGSQSNAISHNQSKAHIEVLKFKANLAEGRNLHEFYCDVCSIFTTSYDLLMTHWNGDKHKARSAIRAELMSKDSSVIAKSNAVFNLERPAQKQDVNNNELADISKTRLKIDSDGQSYQLETFPNEEPDTQANTSPSSSQTDSFEDSSTSTMSQNEPASDWCHCCYVTYNSNKDRDLHLSGKDHARRLRIKEALEVRNDKQFVCEVCLTDIGSQFNFGVHMKSPNHASQLKKYQEYLQLFGDKQLVKSQPSIVIKKSIDESLSTPEVCVATEAKKTEKFELIILKGNDVFDKFDVKMYKYNSSVKKRSRVRDSSALTRHANMIAKMEEIFGSLKRASFTNSSPEL